MVSRGSQLCFLLFYIAILYLIEQAIAFTTEKKNKLNQLNTTILRNHLNYKLTNGMIEDFREKHATLVKSLPEEKVHKLILIAFIFWKDNYRLLHSQIDENCDYKVGLKPHCRGLYMVVAVVSVWMVKAYYLILLGCCQSLCLCLSSCLSVCQCVKGMASKGSFPEWLLILTIYVHIYI